MVGDVNDALSLTAADAGVAWRTRATAASETVDAVFWKRSHLTRVFQTKSDTPARMICLDTNS